MLVPSTVQGQSQLSTPPPVSQRPVSLDTILPADVLARAELFGEDLEKIRFEMGQPKARPFELVVSDVAPREVIYQALALFHNANQLYLEVTETPGAELAIDLPQETKPFHVWRIVNAAYARLLAVKQALGIHERSTERARDEATTPTEVFGPIVEANRQLQLLIRNRISTRDVYQQVSLATHYAERLLERFPGAAPIATPPAFERGKRPVDVYNLLVRCHARVYGIMVSLGFTALRLEAARPEAGMLDPAAVRPSEVYEVATLIVSELAYLHARLDDSEPPVPVRDVGLRIPSHVYRQAKALLLELDRLEGEVKANPSWHMEGR